MKLKDFKALSFDCYGTLIDWEMGIIESLSPLTGRVEKELSRGEILEAHAQAESFQQLTTPTRLYRDLLAVVYKRLAEEWAISVSWDECEDYGRSVGNWKPFPDTVESLRYLKQHFSLVILSNIDNRMFSITKERLGVEFDAIYTAEDIGSYKPSDANFEYMIRGLAALGIEKDTLLHTAESLFHDHVPANRHDIRSCWIQRRNEKEGFGATMKPGEMPSYNFRFESLGEFVDQHRLETAN